MQHCLGCGHDYRGNDWTCPQCGFAPENHAGFLAFAPTLAISNDGFRGDSHDLLDALQETNFWFIARNHLIQDIACRWFASADEILEIGCGTGYVLSGLQQVLPRARFSGSEIYANGLEHAARRLEPGTTLFQMDATAIPFTEHFDLIAACDVLEHLDDDRAALSEMWRALRPGGGILLTVPQHPWLWSPADDFACHKRRYQRRELAEKCREAGFKVVLDTSFVASLLPLMAVQRVLRTKSGSYDPKSEYALPDWANRLFQAALECERHAIGLRIRFPLGGSRVVVAIKAR